VPTNQQRREAERRRLQRQLEQRRAREAARKRFTLIGSIIGTLVVIAAVVIVIVTTTGGGSGKKAGGEKDTVSSPASSTSSPSASASTPAAAAVPAPTSPCAGVPKGDTAKFRGLTIGHATDIKVEPKLSGKVASDPTTVVCQDLVVGKGAVAKTNSSVTAQYVGAIAKTGKVFQSSWGSGAAPSFTIAPGSVIDGFAQGIGGAGKIAPMHAGGRRVIVMPAAAGYGATPPQGSNIPANAALVFIVDVKSVTG
jgi:FKBP-type peptidyl-prolyl cis-trans isomerase